MWFSNQICPLSGCSGWQQAIDGGGAGVGVSAGGTGVGVSVGGTGVSVRSTSVGVLVGTGVSVGGTRISVDGLSQPTAQKEVSNGETQRTSGDASQE